MGLATVVAVGLIVGSALSPLLSNVYLHYVLDLWFQRRVRRQLVRFCEGVRHNWCMAEILWHRRETRRQTEKTNFMPVALEGLISTRLKNDIGQEPIYQNTFSVKSLFIGS